MPAIDTNVLVRLVTKDNPAQFRSAENFLLKNKPVWVSHLTVLELAWVLLSCYRLEKSKVVEILHILLEMEEITVQQPAILEAALKVWQASRIDFADAFILESARAVCETPMGTFDAAMARYQDVQILVP